MLCGCKPLPRPSDRHGIPGGFQANAKISADFFCTNEKNYIFVDVDLMQVPQKEAI